MASPCPITVLAYLAKMMGKGGAVAAGLVRVVEVVLADADDLARPRDGRLEGNCPGVQPGEGAAEASA